MNTVILNNRIKLITNEYEQLTMTLRVPIRNLEKMKQLTDCIIVSKTPVMLDFNHSAGVIVNVTIKVRYNRIASYLQTSQLTPNVEGVEAYEYLIGKKLYEMSYSQCNLLSEKVALYAFGRCSQIEQRKSGNTVFYNKENKKISLAYNGGRHINFKGEWLTNKQF